jgi:peptidoglycan/LPS O-acetylase OafA/YrhL
LGGTTAYDGVPALGHRPGLDGLRALALLAVMVFHQGNPAARGGYLGVSTFFTLSGFLITTLALVEWSGTGRLSWAAFWERRARRLLPAALVTLAAVVALQSHLGIGSGPRFRGDLLASLGYATNWRLAATGGDYAALFASPSPVTHLWSLSVEEQFYLLFPLLFAAVVAAARGRLRWGAAAVGLAGAGAYALAWTSADRSGNDGVTYYGTHHRAGELLGGVALAFVLATATSRRTLAGRTARAALQAAGVAALAGLAWLWHTVAIGDPRLFHGVTALNALLTAVVVVAVTRAGWLDRALGVGPLRAVGKISYAGYLYHWPLFLLLTTERVGLAGKPLFGARLAATLAAAAVSYVAIEAPFRFRLRMPWTRLALTLATGAVVVGALVAAVPVRPPGFADLALTTTGSPVSESASGSGPPASGGHSGDTGGHRGQPALGPVTDARTIGAILPAGRPPTTTVFLAGDSVAYSTLAGYFIWNDRAGPGAMAFQVDTHIAFGCPIGGPGVVRDATEHETFPDCRTWHDELAGRLAASAPDTVVFVMGLTDLRGRDLDGRWREMGDPVHDVWLRGRIDRVATQLESAGAPVLWLTFPHVRALDPADPTRPWRDMEINDPAKVDRLNALAAEVVADHPGITLVDLAGWLRTWPAESFDPADRDGVHFSFQAAYAVVRWLQPRIAPAPTG